MELNEIKKILYKEKPLAIFEKATRDTLMYRSTVKKNQDEDMDLYFVIPISDIGDAVFERFMESQLLIRYIAIHSN